jgi:hypothetical protein
LTFFFASPAACALFTAWKRGRARSASSFYALFMGGGALFYFVLLRGIGRSLSRLLDELLTFIFFACRSSSRLLMLAIKKRLFF